MIGIDFGLAWIAFLHVLFPLRILGLRGSLMT